MGADKGMMMHGEKCWAQIAADKLSQLNIPVKISVSEHQLSAYSKVFSEIDFIVDVDSLSIKGPLLGLLSCHVAYPKEDLFVHACDLLLMETSMLATLIDNYRKKILAHTFLPTTAKQSHFVGFILPKLYRIF